MAERGSSKFAGIFSDRLETVSPPPTPRPAVIREKPARVEKPKATVLASQPPLPTPESHPAPNRRAGKRSDPAYKQFSVLLRKDTHHKAVSILHNADNGQDVSELVQQLLEEWVKKQQR